MNKKLHAIFSIFFVTVPLMAFNSFAEEKYVSENLSVYLTRGPGSEYAIVGSLSAGDKVTVLSKSESGKYTRIKTDDDKIGWLLSSRLTDTPSLKEQVNTLTNELTDAREIATNFQQEKQRILDEYTNKLDLSNRRIVELEQINSLLQTKTEEQQNQIVSLSETVDDSRQELIMKWFVNGGIVAGIGLLLGLVLPMIIPRRKKSNWMN